MDQGNSADAKAPAGEPRILAIDLNDVIANTSAGKCAALRQLLGYDIPPDVVGCGDIYRSGRMFRHRETGQMRAITQAEYQNQAMRPLFQRKDNYLRMVPLATGVTELFARVAGQFDRIVVVSKTPGLCKETIQAFLMKHKLLDKVSKVICTNGHAKFDHYFDVTVAVDNDLENFEHLDGLPVRCILLQSPKKVDGPIPDYVEVADTLDEVADLILNGERLREAA